MDSNSVHENVKPQHWRLDIRVLHFVRAAFYFFTDGSKIVEENVLFIVIRFYVIERLLRYHVTLRQTEVWNAWNFSFQRQRNRDHFRKRFHRFSTHDYLQSRLSSFASIYRGERLVTITIYLLFQGSRASKGRCATSAFPNRSIHARTWSWYINIRQLIVSVTPMRACAVHAHVQFLWNVLSFPFVRRSLFKKWNNFFTKNCIRKFYESLS